MPRLLPDYLTNRFEDKRQNPENPFCSGDPDFFYHLLFFPVWSPVHGLKAISGLSYNTALWIGAFVTITYVFIGGFSGRQLDRHRSGDSHDFRPSDYPRFRDSAIGDLPSALSMIKTRPPASWTCSRDWITAIISGLGTGLLRTTPHSCPLHGRLILSGQFPERAVSA